MFPSNSDKPAKLEELFCDIVLTICKSHTECQLLLAVGGDLISHNAVQFGSFDISDNVPDVYVWLLPEAAHSVYGGGGGRDTNVTLYLCSECSESEAPRVVFCH